MEISLSTLKRLPIYLHYLKNIEGSRQNISATFLARELALGQVQVRKDLSVVGAGGKPKTGYEVAELRRRIESVLGCNEPTVAIIVGAGNLGRALLEHKGFRAFGLDVIAGFDVDDSVIGRKLSGKTIYHTDELESYIKKHNVRLGILTLPDAYAQDMADKLVSGGARGIWNFTQTHIRVPRGVAVGNENMAASLALLNMKMSAANN